MAKRAEINIVADPNTGKIKIKHPDDLILTFGLLQYAINSIGASVRGRTEPSAPTSPIVSPYDAGRRR